MGLREERERRFKKEKGLKIARKEAAVASSSTASSSSKGTQRKGIGIRKHPVSLLSNRKETEEGEAIDAEGGRGGEIEENEDSLVDTDDILNPEGSASMQNTLLRGYTKTSCTLVTRVVKVCYLVALLRWSVTRP